LKADLNRILTRGVRLTGIECGESQLPALNSIEALLRADPCPVPVVEAADTGVVPGVIDVQKIKRSSPEDPTVGMIALCLAVKAVVDL
jgi:hypothetical protein